VELARGLIVLETLESPVTAERRERRYFDYGQVQRRRHGLCLRFVDAVDASDASDCPDTTPTRRALASKPAGSTEWQLGTLNGLSWSGLTRGVTSSGWTAGCVEPRYDKAMRLRCRASAGLQFELQRHLQIHPLRDFVFVVAAGAVVVGTKLQTAPRPLALGLNACSPSSLGRGALPVVGRHPNYPTVHL